MKIEYPKDFLNCLKRETTMNNVLFDELQIISANRNLSEAEKKRLNEIKEQHPKWDQSYITIGCIAETRQIFESLWPAFKDYADPHFLKEIKIQFHQRTWEMYMCNVLLSKGLSIASCNEGPDFIIKDSSGRDALYLECINVTRGVGDDKVPELCPTTEVRCYYPPEKEIILRITAAIKEKMEKYDNWQTKNWFNRSIPYVIAINTGSLGYSADPSSPYMIKALFGVANQYVTINKDSDHITEQGWNFRNEVQKKSGSGIQVNNFLSNNQQNLSGILFSNTDTYNVLLYCQNQMYHHTNLGDDCSYVNNPFASNYLECWFTDFFHKWEAIQNQDGSVSLTGPSADAC